MAKKAARATTKPLVKRRPGRPPKADPAKARLAAVVKPRRKMMGTKSPPRQLAHDKPEAEAMTGYDNPLYEPKIKVFDTVPYFPSDFDDLKTPKSDLAKEIAAKAISPEEYIKTMTTQKRNNAQNYRINPYSLDIVPGFNVHSFDDEATASYIWGLSESIERQGVLRALYVHWTGGKLVVDAGEHRLRATFVAIELRNAHIEGIPIIFAPKGQSDLDRLYQQRLDNTIRRLTILEEGILVKRIIAKSALSEDDAIKEIARNYGTSVAVVQSYLETAALPEEVQQLIRHDRIGATFARQIFRDTGRDPDRTLAIINEAKLRLSDEDEDKKIMPKHVPAEQLAKARAESGSPKRARTSSRLKFQEAQPKSAGRAKSSDVVVEIEDEVVIPLGHSDVPDIAEAVPDHSVMFDLLQKAEPGIMQNGHSGLGFANQEDFKQLCDLLGKLVVAPECDTTIEPDESVSESEPIETETSSDDAPVSASA